MVCFCADPLHVYLAIVLASCQLAHVTLHSLLNNVDQ